MNGKTIRLYLVNGSPTDILTAEIINWTGKIIVAPRSQLAELAKREEVRRTGAYFLVGPDPENTHRDVVYVGESDRVMTRLSRHDKDTSMDFWTRCVVVVSKDENITKSHGRYIESRLISIARQTGRDKVHNDTSPPLPALPEPDTADMEYFLEQLQMIMPVLGFTFLQPKPTVTQPNGEAAETESPVFCLTAGGAEAKARELGGQFVVFKGSTARREGLKSWTSYKSLRKQLLDEGRLIESAQSEYLVFAEDIAFQSPSAGAAVVNAGNINGRTSWKTAETGETYQQWHDKKLAAANAGDNWDE
ncbi:MAG: GIY-YIG nuclease family protein [Planctomycetaceae bacterium]|nr:GIY-YIG nuclease family protein [Planctomycetaceae bacterium]